MIDRDLFASELVIRAGREAVRVMEIPIRLAEKRAARDQPRRSACRTCCKGMAKLTYAIRTGRKS